MTRVLEFDWTEADVVVEPVQAVVVYPLQDGIVIRQKKSTERERDDMVNIPYYALNRLIRRLQLLQNAEIVSDEDIPAAEFVEIFQAE